MLWSPARSAPHPVGGADQVGQNKAQEIRYGAFDAVDPPHTSAPRNGPQGSFSGLGGLRCRSRGSPPYQRPSKKAWGRRKRLSA